MSELKNVIDKIVLCWVYQCLRIITATVCHKSRLFFLRFPNVDVLSERLRE